ncbi:MAG: CRISPR-associated endonuclease Cas3'' [Armatimonadota bacterium]
MPDLLASTFRHLSTALSPSGPLTPADFQLAAAEALLSGRRVVLRAPAGSGKALAAWLPWLAGRLHPCDFPAHMLHVLPGGTFLTDLHRQLGALAAPLGVKEIGIQNEGDAFDPFLVTDAAFTTVDELLSMALHHPLGLHPGLANINAGALLGAYLFFDEFPALASREELLLWLGLLRRYLPFTPCLFGSTVLPRPLLARIAEVLDAEFIDAGEEAGGRRRWLRQPALGVEGILRQHRTGTIVVCNTVRGAQAVYRALARVVDESSCGDLLLIHQHQLYRHRRPLLERAAEIFGPGGRGKGLLITTSGIQVGSDFSAETLITDPISPDHLLLRAARCGRFTGETGRVVVARVSDPVAPDASPGPAWESLVARLADDTPKTAAEEQAALDALWEAEEISLPEVEACDAAVETALAGETPAVFSRVGVALHMVPEMVADPFELERFSLAVTSLERGWQQWQTGGSPGEWFALIPRWPAEGQQAPTWAPVQDARQFAAAARLIVLNSEAVSYDPVIGLELTPGASYQSEQLARQHTTWSPFNQHVQRYEEHAARTLEAFERLTPWFRYVLRHLARHWRASSVELEQWLRIGILWHDAGKLTADWQRAAHRWQAETVRRPAAGVLARVDFRAQRDGQYPCPSHAVYSARVLSRAIACLLQTRPALQRGTLAAFCHHHGPTAMETPDLTPHPEAWATLLELAAGVLDKRLAQRLDRVGWTLTLRGQPDIPATPPADPDAWMAYSLLARLIRLADREVALTEMPA